IPQPPTRARTRFFPGSRTSLPTNVTFVQAVCAKSGPTIDLPKSSRRASPPTNAKPGCATCGLQPLDHEFHQSDLSAPEFALQPRHKPMTTTAASAAVFANVNVFWIIFPTSRPRVLLHVSSMINAIRSEEHTSELQSQSNLVCRLLLEKKKQHTDPVAAPEHLGEAIRARHGEVQYHAVKAGPAVLVPAHARQHEGHEQHVGEITVSLRD